MDAYLSIAEQVLRESRKPLGPREILRRAYASEIVPARLFGRTQHKTLQARISEDILMRKERSAFFRTKPGKFFLREFILDETIPETYRVPIATRRRSRELARPNALAFSADFVDRLAEQDESISPDRFAAALQSRAYHYAKTNVDRLADEVVVWSYVLVLKGRSVLTYRHGRFREDRDTFIKRRSVGFFTPVVQGDLTLFGQGDHGIVEAGMRALCLDLDLVGDEFWSRLAPSASMRCALYADQTASSDLLALVDFHCPDWFEPLTRRLAINDLRWHDLQSRVNDIDDFDPWSQIVLRHAQRTPAE